MRAVSAVDAVSPAIERTRDFLFRPFNWGTYLKLSLVAIFTEGLGSNSRSSSNRGHIGGHSPFLDAPFNHAPERIAVAVAGLLLALVVTLMLFYLITRLRFAYFHCLTCNVQEIRPGWWLFREQAKRFFWLNVVVGICFLLVAGLAALPFVSGIAHLFRDIQQNGHPDMGLLLSLILPLFPVILLLVLIAFSIDLILRDFMLPHYALENATAGEAWSQAWASIRAEKRQFIVYALMRVALPVMAMVVLFLVLIIPGLILAGSLAAVELGLHSVFADASGASATVGLLVQIFFGVLAAGFALLAGICLGGPVSTGIREYALIFYGGRYQALGDIL